MKKLFRRLLICLLLAVFVWFGTVLSDRQRLKEEMIRIHVVANSDSPKDQSLKMSVRDAVLKTIQQDLKSVSDADQAKSYLKEKLPYIESIARETLQSLGCSDSVDVTLQKETFEKRSNAVLSLPAGIYESLRITIGSGQGHNWWSVIFPEACNTVLEKDTVVTVISGFPASVEKSLPDTEYEIRFYFLDALGKLENIFFHG